MFAEIVDRLRDWSSLDSAIALTAMLAAMACALPGLWLVLRRHSMLGDALAHTALPGIVAGFLTAAALESTGWFDPQRSGTLLDVCVIAGATLAGVLTAALTEFIQKQARIDAGAALGVVFTCLFALGVATLRFAADDVHLDADCFLFGALETVALDTITPESWIPRAAVQSGALLVLNLVLTVVFLKELRIAAFDSEQAAVQGVPAWGLHYGLMAVTAMTAAAAFSSVGSILVIGLLIAPGATAALLSDRLGGRVVWSLVLAAASALLGYVAAIALPGPVFSRLGMSNVFDAGAAGMIVVAAGLLFLLAMVIAPRYGLLAQQWARFRLALRIAADDWLGELYRREERSPVDAAAAAFAPTPRFEAPVGATWTSRLALRRLQRHGLVTGAAGTWRLTATGREQGRALVRAHRLWETYLDRNFPLPPDQLHLAADRAEHYLDHRLSRALEAEAPATSDPHGRAIPPADAPQAGS